MSSDKNKKDTDFVWVTVGKTQHPAFRLSTATLSEGTKKKNDENDHHNDAEEHGNPQHDGKILIQWASSNRTEWVDGFRVVERLSPRSRRRRLTITSPPPSPSSNSSNSSSSCYTPEKEEESDSIMNTTTNAKKKRKRRQQQSSGSATVATTPGGGCKKDDNDDDAPQQPYVISLLSPDRKKKKKRQIRPASLFCHSSRQSYCAPNTGTSSSFPHNIKPPPPRKEEMEERIIKRPSEEKDADAAKQQQRCRRSLSHDDTDDDDDDNMPLLVLAAKEQQQHNFTDDEEMDTVPLATMAAALIASNNDANATTARDEEEEGHQDNTCVLRRVTSVPRPPSPPRPSSFSTINDSNTNDNNNTPRPVSRSPQPSAVAMRHHVAPPRPTLLTNNNNNKSGERDNRASLSFPTTETSVSTTPQERSYYYSKRTSAYVQNLAEISYLILNDARWRVVAVVAAGNPLSAQKHNQQRALFRWEDGHDLSAVMALQKLYIPRPPRPNNLPCTCLLCRDSKQQPRSSSQQQQSQSAAADIANVDNTSGNHDNNPTPAIADTQLEAANFDRAEKELVEEKNAEEEAEDDTNARGMYLYCRLFYRKGPWYRIDDVYNKYYAAEKNRRPSSSESLDLDDQSSSPTSASPSDPDGSLQSNASNSDFGTKPLKQNFFMPVGTASASLHKSRASKVGNGSVIDEELLQKHLQIFLPEMFADLKYLRDAGMIRGFDDEAECGKTVGTTLLMAEERNIVLSKLGAGKKRKQPMSNRVSKTHKNSIWKQMTQQRSIFASSSSVNDQKKQCLLPVKHHVEDVLLDRLVATTIRACSRAEYIPASAMRAASERAKKIIKSLIKNVFSCTLWAFRLREEPQRTLQRCARLFLCATSGPGDMRSSGTNGWKSLLVDAVDTKKLPYPTAALPPGQQSWHTIQYPALSHAFGLSSACFLHAYRPLMAETCTTEGVENVQVFYSVNSFHCWELCVELRANVDYLIELNEIIRYNERRQARGKDAIHHKTARGTTIADGSVDFLNLLEETGRENLLSTFLRCCPGSNKAEIRAAIAGDMTLVSSLSGECERVLGVIGIVAFHILRCCHDTISPKELQKMASRPWLRHLSWHGCVAYILWDIFPIFERNARYILAVRSLEILLFGRWVDFGNDHEMTNCLSFDEPSGLAPLLLSRRARGKAFDRLIIDCSHIHRIRNQGNEGQAKRASSERFRQKVTCFSRHVVEFAARYSFIGFSAVRTLARRLKQPLRVILDPVDCHESSELGLRHGNEVVDSALKSTKYCDWTAPTDTFLANALAGEEKEQGNRCAYVGFEEEEESERINPTSLNVEELAKQLYSSGRLPSEVEPTAVKGGWVGWHDEGAQIRALFRIICSAPMFGMDFGCASARDGHDTEHFTIHLSPYQAIPFDLHAGYIRSTKVLTAKGFYARKSVEINAFLSKLERLRGQELCDLVFDSIASRLQYMACCKQKDPFLDRDVIQVRTFSALAAGLGGKLLAAVFRCLLFDYRHYCGGLPDLHLFRCMYEDSKVLVDLGEWLGEAFSKEVQEEMESARGALFLSDEEFLGCSKVGDSGSQSGRRSRQRSVSKAAANKVPSTAMLPERLRLFHNGRAVRVECMLVEVKSSNDRLDPRQEDWLNCLDQHGNARVCKFEQNQRKKQK